MLEHRLKHWTVVFGYQNGKITIIRIIYFFNGGGILLLPQTLQFKIPIQMENAIWFLILVVLSLVPIAYTFYRKKNSKLLSLFLGLSAIASYFENVILHWFNSYKYYPGILKNPYYDLSLGAYLSQVFYVSSVALFIAAFQLRFGWILFFSAMFLGIEYSFLALGVYKVNWWHPAYTFITLPVYFWIGKKWYILLLQGSSHFVRWFTLVGINYVIYVNFETIPFFSGHYHFTAGWFGDPSKDTVAVLIVYTVARAVIMATICFYRIHWTIMAMVTSAIWAGYLVSIQLHILSFKYLWSFFVFMAFDIAILLICRKFNRVLLDDRKSC